jgi:hypothetical protein
MTLNATDVTRSIQSALDGGAACAQPFRHWLLRGIIPASLAAEVCALPVEAPRITDTLGKRETNNALRRYFSPQTRWNWPAAQVVADAFQARPTVESIEARCGTRLVGSFLRIEYCQDTDGFWLEPHTDIRVKLLTLIVYLSEPAAAEEWGTDLYHPDLSAAGRAPFGPGLGLAFVPASDTWHGFQKRPITGVRRSLIVNYVTPEWRARRELAFPDMPVG